MEVYYDLNQPGSYGGIDALYRLMRSKDSKVTRKQVTDWLAEQEAYSLHKPVRRRFARRRVYSTDIDALWQADLVDMTQLAEHNQGYKFLLTVIDVLSKFAWAIPLKNKSSKSVTDAFCTIFTQRKPNKLNTDKGTEFKNATLQKKLRELGIQFYTTQNEDIKASVIERFNRTLKTKMWKYFTHKNTYKYYDVLQDMLKSYNSTYHRTIGRSPDSVKPEHVKAIRERMYGNANEFTLLKTKFKVGDMVRISKTRKIFDKGYLPNWSEELFIVSEVLQTWPTTYRIKDLADEQLEGSFYEKEMQKVTKIDNVYKVEKIISTRRKGGVKQMLIKWRGYPNKFNSWVDEADVMNAI
jgi:hypothetical protein